MSDTLRRLSAVRRVDLLLVAFVVLLAGCKACERRVHVEHLDIAAYPTCDGEPLPEGEVLTQGELRSGPGMRDQNVFERYEIRERGCVFVATVRQEWPLGIADVEVIYDKDWRPIRVWKRMTLPNTDMAETRLFDLTQTPVALKWRTKEGELRYRQLGGGAPARVVGPGRGLLWPWIHNVDLEVEGVERTVVLDVRREFARVEEVSLRRDPDFAVEGLGTVRVHSVFGRESVFTNSDDELLGDLSGLRRAQDVSSPRQEALTSPTPPDPQADF